MDFKKKENQSSFFVVINLQNGRASFLCKLMSFYKAVCDNIHILCRLPYFSVYRHQSQVILTLATAGKTGI